MWIACGEMSPKTRATIEFGDFQTPKPLATRAAAVLRQRGVEPLSIVEPTCGAGVFLEAALECFPAATRALGLEINPAYFTVAKNRVAALKTETTVDVQRADFFGYDWARLFHDLPEPILAIGNPPWVTASQLGAMQSKNLPRKSNYHARPGLEAITGKANFDIAEWMLTHLVRWLSGRHGTVAMLVKQSVARKVLSHAWKQGAPLADADLYTFDARVHFGASVEACLLVCDLRPGPAVRKCQVRSLDMPDRVDHALGALDGMLLADMDGFDRQRDLLRDPEAETVYKWRSGVKHDCARVMEFAVVDGRMQNGFGNPVEIEPDYVYPLLKGSAVANGQTATDRYMLVTQGSPGDETNHIREDAPRTWDYLNDYAKLLDARKSSIYRRRARFAVFGVGEYTFAPWKVAICGLYKRLTFRAVGPRNGKPVVFDDTVYFVACKSEREAALVQQCLQSDEAQEFLNAFIFWDSKRPVTAELLGRLDLLALAEKLGCLGELSRVRPDIQAAPSTRGRTLRLF